MIFKHYIIYSSLDEGIFQVQYCNTFGILNYFTIIALLHRLNSEISESIILPFIIKELFALPHDLQSAYMPKKEME